MFKPGFYEKIGYESFKNMKNYRDEYNSLMTPSQISMLLGLISGYKFSDGRGVENVLEIGVYNGVTSMYMLKEGVKNHKNYYQAGIDIATGDFFGGCVKKEASEEEKAHIDFHFGKTVLNIEEIVPNDKKFDLVFIDGGHHHPSPLFNLVSIIPYLHSESIVCLHDVVDYMRPNAWGETFIYEGWLNKKYRNRNIFRKDMSEETLGVIEIPQDKKALYENLLTIVKVPFRAAPWKVDEKHLGVNRPYLRTLEPFMRKHYSESFVDKFMSYMYKNLEKYEEEYLLRIQETRFYNYLYEKIRKLEKEVFKSDTLSQLLLKNCDKKILFWGGSLFLKEYLNKNDLSKLNIVGVIDKSVKTGQKEFCGLKLYAPEELKGLDANIIISTVKNSNQKVYEDIKQYLTTNNINTELAPNIFNN